MEWIWGISVRGGEVRGTSGMTLVELPLRDKRQQYSFTIILQTPSLRSLTALESSSTLFHRPLKCSIMERESNEKRQDHVRRTASRNVDKFSALNKYNILTPDPQQAHHSSFSQISTRDPCSQR
jgi:hypothetical protein